MGPEGLIARVFMYAESEKLSNFHVPQSKQVQKPLAVEEWLAGAPPSPSTTEQGRKYTPPHHGEGDQELTKTPTLVRGFSTDDVTLDEREVRSDASTEGADLDATEERNPFFRWIVAMPQ